MAAWPAWHTQFTFTDGLASASDGLCCWNRTWPKHDCIPCRRSCNHISFSKFSLAHLRAPALNDFQSLGQTSKVLRNFYPILDKTRAFGWDAHEVDGHDPQAIFDGVKRRSQSKPMVLLGRTTKGKGVTYMENVPIWHYRSPNPEEYQQAVKQVEES